MRSYVLWDAFLCNVSNTVVVYLISSLGEFVGEVLSDFANESAFEPSVVKIYQKSIDFGLPSTVELLSHMSCSKYHTCSQTSI